MRVSPQPLCSKLAVHQPLVALPRCSARAMTFRYKLPRQQARELPSDLSTVQAAKDYICELHQMEAHFKLRHYVEGKAVYLKPDQQLQGMPSGSVLNVFYPDSADTQRKRRLQASLTASLVRADMQDEAHQTRTHIKSGVAPGIR